MPPVDHIAVTDHVTLDELVKVDVDVDVAIASLSRHCATLTARRDELASALTTVDNELAAMSTVLDGWLARRDGAPSSGNGRGRSPTAAAPASLPPDPPDEPRNAEHELPAAGEVDRKPDTATSAANSPTDDQPQLSTSEPAETRGSNRSLEFSAPFVGLMLSGREDPKRRKRLVIDVVLTRPRHVWSITDVELEFARRDVHIDRKTVERLLYRMAQKHQGIESLASEGRRGHYRLDARLRTLANQARELQKENRPLQPG